MNNPGLPDSLWEILDGRLWHATGPSGLKGIKVDAEIGIRGHRYRESLCRALECVALFDFGPDAVGVECQFDKWSGWFGHQQESRVAVWLEVDRYAAAENVIDAGEMHREWKKNLSKQCIPGVEAGHRGPVPLRSIGEVLLIDQHDRGTFERNAAVDESLLTKLVEFERSLPPEPGPDPLIEGLRRHRPSQK